MESQALGHKDRADALQAQVLVLQVTLAARDAAVSQAAVTLGKEQAARRTTGDEKRGLILFRLMATWLINAHIAGRADRPAFAEMRDMAKEAADAIERGEIFWGYRDEPEKKERLRSLLDVLLSK